MVKLQLNGFDWDAGNRKKCQQHGVSLQEIEDLFLGSVAVLPDLAHSKDEQRFHAVGKNRQGRYIFLVFTLRSHDDGLFLRPISARYMHHKEIARYEKDISKSDQR